MRTFVCAHQRKVLAAMTDRHIWFIKRLTIMTVATFTLSAMAFASQTTVTVSGLEQGGGNLPYDAGSLSVTVNGRIETVLYGQFSTAQSVASGLAAKFSLDCNSPVKGMAQGAIITFTTKESSDTFFQISSESVWNSASFSQNSFGLGQSTPAAGLTVTPLLTISCDPNPVPAGGSVDCTAQLPVGATGSVTFSVDAQSSWSTSVVDPGGWAPASILNGLQAGTHSVQASYSGDNQYNAVTETVSVLVLTSSLESQSVYSYSITQTDGTTSGYATNGNMLAYNDSVNGQWSLQYDGLNRLAGPASALLPGATSPQYWCWNYDSFGNRTQEASSTAAFQNASCTTTGSVTNNWTSYNANNQITGTPKSIAGLLYDGAGDVTYDGTNSYLYDAEGRVCATGNAPFSGGFVMYQYIYDADGHRVAKGTNQPAVVNGQPTLTCNLSGITLTNSYVLGQGGEQVTEMTVTGGQSSWAHTNVYAGRMLLATYDPVGLHFQVTDWLGSRRVQTNAFGQVEEKCQNSPFGNGLNCRFPEGAPTTADDATEQHFTGKERDSESGLDYFGARYYGSSMGRMMSPDPFIPFNLKRDDFQEWISNPQHWNKYAYVLNNPLKFTDPTGMTETIYYRLATNATDAQKKFFNDNKDAILKAIGDKLNAAGIKDVVFRDAATLTSAQQNSIITNAPKGVAMLSFADKSFGTWHPDSGTYGGSGGDNSAVLVGNLQAGNPNNSTLIFRIGEVSSHELGHDMGFFSRGATMSFIQPWNSDLMNEGQGIPTSPRNFDMSIPQNRQTVDEINKLPPYTPH